MKLSCTNRIELVPDDACSPPIDVKIKILYEQLSDADKTVLLSEIWGDHPEVFEEALHNMIGRIRARRARRAEAPV